MSLNQFQKHDQGGNYYGTRHSLKVGGQTLVNLYSCPKNPGGKLYHNDRNLVTINGLVFANSALNSLQLHPGYPHDSALDLQRLCNAIIELHGHITQIDVALDDVGGNHLD